MGATTQVATLASDLVGRGEPFVLATVVRAQCPTSTRPGDAAVVLADGTIEGFVGGRCAEESVRTAALDVLASGEELLLRILPDDAEPFPESPGARTTVNPCLSGGAIEVFLEPRLPPPVVAVVGTTPIAEALADLARRLGFTVEREPVGRSAPATSSGGCCSSGGDGAAPAVPALPTAVIVASHGRDEPESIRAALDAGVGYIGLVASRVRGGAVIEALELSGEERERVHSPVGLVIGARTADEVALSIVADLVRAIRLDGLSAPTPRGASARPATATDPVCGMTVTITATTPHLDHDGVDLWFCNPGCRDRHAAAVGAP